MACGAWGCSQHGGCAASCSLDQAVGQISAATAPAAAAHCPLPQVNALYQERCITVQGSDIRPVLTFEQTGLPKNMLHSTRDFVQPSPIQSQVGQHTRRRDARPGGSSCPGVASCHWQSAGLGRKG